MQSEELLEKAVKSAMLSVIKEHPMGHWRDDHVKEVARRAIVEAALSAAKPVSSRNDEAGYVEFLNEDVPYIVRDMQGAVAILLNLETRNVVGYRVYDPDSVFAPSAPSVAVKALEWAIPTGCNDYYWNALSVVGQYRIRPKAGHGFELLRLMADTFPFYSSVDEAKAAAQADYEARIRSALSAQVHDDYEQNGYCKVIDVEKLLCEKLGRKWSATGISIVSLVNELATHMLDVTGWERLTVETGRKSGTSHADVWPDGEGWEIDTDRGRVNTPDAGWDRFSNHEELYFRRRANDLPAAPAKQEGGHD